MCARKLWEQSSDNVNCDTHARRHTHTQAVQREAGKQCSTMLSGRDLKLQKKGFQSQDVHSDTHTHTQAGVTLRETDLYDVH